jgi:DNA-binding NtrC family response regulator
MKIPGKHLTQAALEKLCGYPFPGNIRELRNLLERALILGQSTELQPEDFYLQAPALPPQGTHAEASIESLVEQLPSQLDLRDAVTRLEKALINRALDLAKGVQAEAARKLGLSRSDLGYKIGRHGLAVIPDKGAEEGCLKS